MAKGSYVRSPCLWAVRDFSPAEAFQEQEILAWKAPREGQAGAFMPQEAAGVGQLWPVSGVQCVASHMMNNEV